MKISVDVDWRDIERKLSKENFAAGQYAAANQALSDMTPYVPFKRGDLKQQTAIDIDGTKIRYLAKYARRQFYAPGGWNYTTPGTGPRWDKKAKSIHGDDWAEAFLKGAGLK